ncbi:MAG: SpoVA/SpoVAEb family sporulation membrane protein [Lachnospiraceae bacterium]
MSQISPEKQKEYNQYVNKVTPSHNLWLNMLKAFIVGGIICVIGQLIINYCLSLDVSKDLSYSWASLSLIALSVLLTGLNLFPSIAKFAGAGALVPITGFANSIAAAAIEFKKEGQVFGIGCKIFTIAGPVILFGLCTSSGLGLIYWILKLAGVV